MAIRLHEMHPAIVHVPIAFLPVSVGADLLGQLAGEPLYSFGRKAAIVAAAGAVGAGISGLIAGEEVNVEGRSRDMLVTHRNLNFVAMLVVSGMALWRRRRERPSSAYIALGVAACGVLGYTAYLGGKLVSHFGVGVLPAKGIYRPDAPELGKAPVTTFAKAAGTDLVHGVEHLVEEIAAGQIVPALIGGSGENRRQRKAATAPA